MSEPTLQLSTTMPVVDITLQEPTPDIDDSILSRTALRSQFNSREAPSFGSNRHSWGEDQFRTELYDGDAGLKKPRAASDGHEIINQGIGNFPTNSSNLEFLTRTYIEMTHATNVDETRRMLEVKVKDIARAFKAAVFTGAAVVFFLAFIVLLDALGAREFAVIVYYSIGSLLTVISTSYILYTFIKLGPLNRHPASLHVWGSVCDLLFTIPLFAQALREATGITETPNQVENTFCEGMTFITQVTLMGSVTWFVMLSWDLFRTLRQPFVNQSKQLSSYHIFTWTVSFLSGILLVASEGSGVSNVCVCWIESQDKQRPNARMWVFYYAFVCIYFLFSIGVLAYCMKEWKMRFRSARNAEFNRIHDEATLATLQMRRTIIKNNAFHIVSYLVYFFVLFIFYNTYDRLRTENDDDLDGDGTVECRPTQQETMPLLKVFAVLVSSKGVVNALVWYFKSNLGNLQYELILKSEIPHQYRKDVMRCTLIGIRDTALMASGPSIDDIHHQRYFQCLLEMNVEGTSTQYSFVFRSYAMLVFRHIREANGITTESYLQSLCGSPRGGELSISGEDLKETFSEGKSGSFLYFSKDKRFIIKTMSHSEAKVLLSILNSYHTYMDKNPNTFITRLYGLHSINISGLLMYFVVMENVTFIPPERSRTFTFDLKGSWVDREAGLDDPSKCTKTKPKKSSYCPGLSQDDNHRSADRLAEPVPKAVGKTLKDTDFKRIFGRIAVGAEMKARIVSQIQADTQFFCNLGIMDYSLLLAVSEGIRTPRDRRTSRRQSLSHANASSSYSAPTHATPFYRQFHGGVEERTDEDRQSIISESTLDRAFHIGIIDLFQEYNLEKKAEHWIKVHLRRKDGDGISCVPAELYAQRFTDMVDDILA
eukprot:TRINITY_DN4922_c1_g1_i1.p1 TRINITY_DN4922_c1_g1~~TRINITY_DN4922_c1_g1_i1.p1  ORF type:complete len:881 (-),score=161.69 TRINITY_DN4922_c1_g1_i1:442-3084(-)